MLANRRYGKERGKLTENCTACLLRSPGSVMHSRQLGRKDVRPEPQHSVGILGTELLVVDHKSGTGGRCNAHQALHRGSGNSAVNMQVV